MKRFKLNREKQSGIDEYRFSIQGDVEKDIHDRYGYDGDLLRVYTEPRDSVVHKWHHYIPIYDRYFSPWRDRPLRFLEIGVSKGGSLAMWRSYFGEQATIFGIDIDSNCLKYDGVDGSVRIGSQADTAFLAEVIAEMGGVDVVLDDGSHCMSHIRKSLETLFPLLSQGGLYVIEDLHTAYWAGFEGGYGKPGNFFNYVRNLVDDMHSWYHDRGSTRPIVSDNCSAIHIFDSICILEKNRKQKPTHSSLPREHF